MMRIVVDKNIPYIKGVLEPYFEVIYKKGTDIDAQTVRDADALVIRTRTKCNSELLQGSKVRFIASATIGEDHVDRKYCEDAGIELYFAKGCNSKGVMQYVFTALSYLYREKGYDVQDKVLGVVGVGNVGSKVAWMGQCLGLKVLCCDTPRVHEKYPDMNLSDYRIVKDGLTYVSLDYLLRHSDIVTLHVPLDTKSEFATYRMADRSFFQRMKAGSVFINASRGEVVDDNALKEAVGTRLRHTVLDVWNNEPGIDRDLLNLVDLATPHIAGYSLQGKVNGSNMVVNALGRHFGIPELTYIDFYETYGIDSPHLIQNYFVSCKGNPSAEVKKQAAEQFSAACLEIFPVEKLDQALRKPDSDFETMRSEYKLRNEILIPEMK